MIVDPNHIQLTADQQAELAELSAASGKPWPVVLDQALASYRREEGGRQDGNGATESFVEAASRLGLIGCLQGGPADLSTNPDHMEGFGQSDG